jgi:alkanesulfonate monooxygenase SsuD/methylene tetrahydromethanopterin reductase-like flavin-dependent oxidoreductase (luciferase family)
VLSSDDPVRVFQRYSTLNAVSGGRAEVILGRGSSVDSFPLFGYDLADYEELFEEKTHLFAELLNGGPVTWQGNTRAALRHQDVVPHTENGPFPAWIGVGGSPQSGTSARAASPVSGPAAGGPRPGRRLARMAHRLGAPDAGRRRISSSPAPSSASGTGPGPKRVSNRSSGVKCTRVDGRSWAGPAVHAATFRRFPNWLPASRPRSHRNE